MLRRRACCLALCLPALLIVVMARGNGASDFNVVIYVVCLEWCVLNCISSQTAHINTPPAFVRGRVKSLFALWSCQGATIWGELTNCRMPIKGQLMAPLYPSPSVVCQCCCICAFSSEERQCFWCGLHGIMRDSFNKLRDVQQHPIKNCVCPCWPASTKSHLLVIQSHPRTDPCGC